MAIVIKKENQNKTSQQNAEAVNKAYGNDGAPNDPYDRDYTAQSAKGYTPKDTTTVNNSMYYAKEEKMSDADRASLTNAGVWYNDAKSRGDTAAMEEAHALAEQIRGKYGYSGGTDGSEYIKTEKEYTAPSSGGGVGYGGGTAGAKVDKLTNRAPDLTGLLNSWLDSAKQQQENKIDYAVNQGVNELQRAEEDAQAKFQTQQNQVDENEAKALDNQALYAEARGDRGGIGQAQYAQIQATAMTNRRTINSARTKLATDTARQIADLRAQGEFQKADAVLELSQTYLSQLMDLEKWGAEFNLDVDKFNSQIDMWQAEFDASIGEMLGYYNGMPTLENQKYQTSVDQWNQQFQTSKDQWNQEFNFNVQRQEKETLANSGLAALSVGIRPSAAQQAAMGYTNAQVDAELAAYKLAQAAGVKGSGGGGNPVEKAPDVKTDPMGYLNYHQVRTKEQAEAILALTFKEDGHAAMLAEQYAAVYLSDHNYNALLSELAKIESGAAPDRVKIDKIIDEIEKAAKSGKITPDQEMSLLAQYGLG